MLNKGVTGGEPCGIDALIPVALCCIPGGPFSIFELTDGVTGVFGVADGVESLYLGDESRTVSLVVVIDAPLAISNDGKPDCVPP